MGRIFGLEVEASCPVEKAKCCEALELFQHFDARCDLAWLNSYYMDQCSTSARTKKDDASKALRSRGSCSANYTNIRADNTRLFEIRRQESNTTNNMKEHFTVDANVLAVVLSVKITELSRDREFMSSLCTDLAYSARDDGTYSTQLNHSKKAVVEEEGKAIANIDKRVLDEGSESDVVRLIEAIHPDLTDYHLVAVIEADSKHHKRSGPATTLLFDCSGYALGTGRDDETVQSMPLPVALANQIRKRCANGVADTLVKAFPISSLRISINEAAVVSLGCADTAEFYAELPSCPTCVNRIDPNYFTGLSSNSDGSIASKSIGHDVDRGVVSPPLIVDSTTSNSNISKYPSFVSSNCLVCEIIENYSASRSNTSLHLADSYLGIRCVGLSRDLHLESSSNTLKCSKCDMTQTLWICLTCGIVSCGRYSHAHAVEHFHETKHPYSLELATQRVWAYDRTHFVQRRSSTSTMRSNSIKEWLGSGEQVFPESRPTGTSTSATYLGGFSEAQAQFPFNEGQGPSHGQNGMSSKKSSMVGEVYEARLEASLAHQAEFYEGEMSSMRAEISGQQTMGIKVPSADKEELTSLKLEMSALENTVSELTEDVIKLQCREEERRMSNKVLLRQQLIQNKVLTSINTKMKDDMSNFALHIEELKQQIWDLEAFFKIQLKASKCSDIKEATVMGLLSTSKDSRGLKGKRKKKLNGK